MRSLGSQITRNAAKGRSVRLGSARSDMGFHIDGNSARALVKIGLVIGRCTMTVSLPAIDRRRFERADASPKALHPVGVGGVTLFAGNDLGADDASRPACKSGERPPAMPMLMMPVTSRSAKRLYRAALLGPAASPPPTTVDDRASPSQCAPRAQFRLTATIDPTARRPRGANCRF